MESNKHLSRREFLRLAAAAAAGTAVVACQPQTVVVEKEKEVPVTQIVEVEKEVTKIVAGTPVIEKVVETQVVEKVVTATPVPPTPTPTGPREVSRENTLIIGFEGQPVADPEQMNPLVPGSRVNMGYHQCVIESLYYLNYQDGEQIPWLAEGPPEWNDDYTEVTVPIRKGVEWSDGEPFTAEDLVFTINMVKENTTLAYGAAMQKWVQEAVAVDDFTAKITLTEPNPRFIYQNFAIRIWGGFRIVPKHIFEDKDPMTFKFYDPDQGWPVWTGPYRLVQGTPSEFIWDRRDDWWAAKTGFHELPAPERIIFIESGDQDKKAAMLEADLVDGEPQMTLEAFEKVREKNPNAIGWMEEAPFAWIDPCPSAIKFQCETPPWDDPEMRWAVAYAIDNTKLSETMGGGYGVPARFQFPMYPYMESLLDANADLFETWDMRDYDPERAKQIIESKGYTMGPAGVYMKDGKPLQAEVLGVAPGATQIFYAAYLKQVGIDAVPKLVSVAAYHDTVALSQFELDGGWSYCGSVADPWASFDSLHMRWILPKGERHSGNYGNWANEEFSEISDAIGQLPPGDPGIDPLFRQGLEIWLRELPVMAVAQQLRIVPYSTRYWTNWPTEKNGYYHPPNWWMCFLQVILKLEKA